MLVQHFGKELLLDRAAIIDLGFDRRMFAGMFPYLDKIPDREIPADLEEIPRIREFFAQWREELIKPDNNPQRAPGIEPEPPGARLDRIDILP